MFLRHIFTKYGKDEYKATVVIAVHTVKLSYTLVVSFCFGSEGGHTTPSASDLIISFLCSCMGFESDLFIIAVIYVINSGLHLYFG